MYRLIVELEDKESFDAASAIESIKPVVGDNAVVKAFPINNSPKAHLKFAISELIVHNILEAYFELYPHLYKSKAEKIKKEIVAQLTLLVDEVESEILSKLE